MPTLYHKLCRLSRAKTEFYCKTSAPRKPTKQAPTNKNKNVIFSPFILLYIIGKHKPNTLEIPEKYLTFFLLRFSLNKDAGGGRGDPIEIQSQLSLSDSHHLLNTSRASDLSRPNSYCNSRGAPIILMEPLSRKSSRNSKYSCMSILLLPDTCVRFLV